MTTKSKPITPELRERIKDALNQTWNAIGYDVLQANDGKDMPRSHVIEVCWDAGHWEMYGGLSQEEIKEVREIPYAQKLKIGKEAFPYSRYGM